ncbi:hypothetical protein EJ08DRAFT_701000 [Tothia fuscella]|uniref:Alpha-ketoglutarate-dependent dioxygenase AlkB-like domain-containing protein n=1 Tax=Tothia fuscella TaxID=1048955 RepID=A0A9P4NIZ1_9PEZI|nr:hypothetical protein EJ08DRAFT_701000 [Tothia fuscella]
MPPRKRKLSGESASSPTTTGPALKKPRKNSMKISANTTRITDSNLLTLSHQILTQNKPVPEKTQPNSTKPLPKGKPEVWAGSRMELKETLPWYNAMHSAAYTKDGYVHGFMFDSSGDSAEGRDIISTDVVVQVGAGGKVDGGGGGDGDGGEGEGGVGEEGGEKGEGKGKKDKLQRGKDQKENASTRSYKKSCQEKKYVGVILGDKSPCAKFRNPHFYSVLGNFIITEVWCERSSGVVVYKHRLENAMPKAKTWWEPIGLPDPVESGSLDQPHSQVCVKCGREFQQHHVGGWMCLNGDCVGFWKFNDGTSPDEKEEEIFQGSMVPPLWTPKEGAGEAQHMYESAMAGICCPRCGRCVSRRAFWNWKCEGPNSCGHTITFPHTTIPTSAIRSTKIPLSNGFTKVNNKCHRDIKPIEREIANYHVLHYVFEGVGTVSHFLANRTAVEARNGADEMYRDVQGVDVPFMRRAKRASKYRGRSFAAHFAINYGMPYKYNDIETQDLSFKEAPPVIHKGRSMINWAIRAVCKDLNMINGHNSDNDVKMTNFDPDPDITMLEAPPPPPSPSPSASTTAAGKKPKKPSAKTTASTPGYGTAKWIPNLPTTTPKLIPKEVNEILANAYPERSVIGAHDDGETGLGESVVTLSLGDCGTFTVRMKDSIHSGLSSERGGGGGKNKAWIGGPVIRGCRNYTTRLVNHSANHARVEAAAKISNDAATNERRAIATEMDLLKKAAENKLSLLTLQVNHGDLVVMTGKALHAFLEHEAKHGKGLRVVLTGREILGEHLVSEGIGHVDVGVDGNFFGGEALPSPNNAGVVMPEGGGFTGELFGTVKGGGGGGGGGRDGGREGGDDDTRE